jgi:hypothetical protein
LTDRLASFANCSRIRRNAVGAIGLVADVDWPPRAVTMRVLDLDGREVHSKMKDDAQSWRLCGAQDPAEVSVALSAVNGGFAQIPAVHWRLSKRIMSTLCRP